MRIFLSLFMAIISSSIIAQGELTTSNSIGSSKSFTLIWQDEFNNNGPVDSNKWFLQTQLPLGGSWYNGEIQHYTNRMDNAVVENGVLKIIAKKETYTDQGVSKNYTSARLNSKFAFKYGRVEIRAKLPTGNGTWPALWMLGKNINEDGAYFDQLGYGTTPWPACGEIDIMEHWGSNQNYVQSATHTPSSYGGTVNLGGRMLPTASTAFHVYALEWTADQLVFSIDSIIHYTYNPSIKDASTWPFDLPQYLLMNIAIQPSIDTAFSSSSLEIDYVRIYQESNVNIENIEANRSMQVFPNPFSKQLQLSFETQPNQPAHIQIFSSNGRLMKSYTTVGQQYFSIRNLDSMKPGIYFLKVQIGNQCYNRKIFKK